MWAIGALISLLGTGATTALGLGAWAFLELRAEAKSLGTQATELKDSINDLGTEVAVLSQRQREVASVKADLREHAAELGHPHGVAAMVEAQAAEIKALRLRVVEHLEEPGHAVTVDRLSELKARIDQIERTRWSRSDHEAWARDIDRRIQRLEGKPN